MATRFGVPARGLFLTNVVVIILGKANGMAFMQLMQHAVRERQPTPLTVDDSDATAPAFFFDVTFSDVHVSRAGASDPRGGLPVRASVFGVKGMANPHLPTLLASGHAFIVATDGDEPPLLAARTIAGKVHEDRREQVYPALVNDDEEAHAVLRAVLADLARKASAPA